MTEKRKVCLREVTEKDVAKLYEWWTNGKVMEPVGFPNGLSITLTDVYQAIKRYEDIKDSAFLIILSESGVEIGEFAYSKLSKDTYTFDIKIGNYSYQGQGYGKQALLEGINLIKLQKNAKRIEIHVAPENLRALALYESVGFKRIKRIENNWKDQLGNPRSTEVLELVI